MITVGLFESTAIQFGMDQMLEASSDQLSTFIHWYYWSSNIGPVVIHFMSAGVLLTDMQHSDELYKTLHPYYYTILYTAALRMVTLYNWCAHLSVCVYWLSTRNTSTTTILTLTKINAWRTPRHSSVFF